MALGCESFSLALEEPSRDGCFSLAWAEPSRKGCAMLAKASWMPSARIGLSVCRNCTRWSLSNAVSIFLVYWLVDHSDLHFEHAQQQLDPYIVEALVSNDWKLVEDHCNFRNTAFLIGDRSGPRFETAHGWASLDAERAVASVTKSVTGLAIYRLMGQGRLNPESRVAEFVEAWAQDVSDPGGNVTLAHLLSLTTGFRNPSFWSSCARPWRQGLRRSWEDCVNEIAHYPITHVPGTRYSYGPAHLVVAAAAAHKAVNRELHTSEWVSTLREEVYVPSNITERPVFGSVLADVQKWFPFPTFGLGCPEDFPDFSGGLQMSARQVRQIAHAFQFGALLERPLFERFIEDHSVNVSTWEMPDYTGSKYSWHYAQTSWLKCRGPTGLADVCGADDVIFFTGRLGSSVWMDMNRGYHVVMIRTMAEELAVAAWVVLLVNILWCRRLAIIILYK